MTLPYLYEQVKLTDSSEGVIKYIGEIEGKNGTFFGVEMLDGSQNKADTNGTINDQQYFTCTNNASIGRFIQDTDIESTIKPATHNLDLIGSSPPFTIGDRVFV
eukprot:126140_1